MPRFKVRLAVNAPVEGYVTVTARSAAAAFAAVRREIERDPWVSRAWLEGIFEADLREADNLRVVETEKIEADDE